MKLSFLLFPLYDKFMVSTILEASPRSETGMGGKSVVETWEEKGLV